MQILPYREIIQRLGKEGWMLVRQKGSHKQFMKSGKRTGERNDQPTVGEWNDIRNKAGWQ